MACKRIAYSEKAIERSLCDGKSVMVRGGAGCGKTYALVRTVRNLLDKYPHTRIACITYTNAAADEVTRRLDYTQFSLELHIAVPNRADTTL